MRLRNSEIVTTPKFYTVRFVRVVEGGGGGGNREWGGNSTRNSLISFMPLFQVPTTSSLTNTDVKCGSWKLNNPLE